MTKKRKKRTQKKKSHSFIFKLLLFIVLLIAGFFVGQKDEKSDYSNLNGLSGAELKTNIHNQIRNHQYLDFDQNTTARYWWDNYFKKTDWNSKGYFWDMYSNNKNATYKGGNIQNREHVMPRSWWGYRKQYSSYDANGDLHNLYPADSKANSAKGNLPLGEVGITIFDNGVSKVGKNTYPKGYRGDVFEPADEYKGDFARIYFYMVTCYQDYANQWRTDATKSMLEKNTYPSLQPWAIDMLLKWHRQDPVSEKEIDRNNEVFRLQGNRNPYIDNPELVEYIWGNKKEEPYLINSDTLSKEKDLNNKNYRSVLNYLKEVLNSVI